MAKRFRKDADDDGDAAGGMDSILSVSLSSKRIARVYEFKGMMLCDVREVWFDAAGNAKPSKKGISLTLDQLKNLFAHKDEILAAMEGAAGEAPSKGKSKAKAGADDEGEEEAAEPPSKRRGTNKGKAAGGAGDGAEDEDEGDS